MRTLSFRRAQSRRAKEKAKRILKIFAWRFGTVAAPSPTAIGRLATTRKLCSCDLCGNPRRHSGLRPISELRNLEANENGRSDIEM